MSKPKKNRPGRPKLPASERTVLISTTLPPAVAAKLAEANGGSASRGLRVAAVEWAARN